MRKHFLIGYLLLFAYAGAVMHSIVPHHHHDSAAEAKEHHHHDHHGDHHHSHDATNASHESGTTHEHSSGSFHFLTHTGNVDVLVNHAPIDGAIKAKKSGKVAIVVVLATFVYTPTALGVPVFHPPAGDTLPFNVLPSSGGLRAPPAIA